MAKRVADPVSGIEEKAAADRPNQVKKSPAPFFHAATRRVHDEFYQMYAAFVAAFRDATEKLRGRRPVRRLPAWQPPSRLAVGG